MWHCWISASVEGDENVKRDKTINFIALLNTWNCWIRYDVKKIRLLNEIRLWNQIRLVNLYTFEIDENVKRGKTVEFVTWLNMWDCWMRYERESR